jgi:hypothetical protein
MKLKPLNQLPNRTIKTDSFIEEIQPRLINTDNAVIEVETLTKTPINNTTEIKDDDGVFIQSTISKFKNNGYIRISGDYKQNFVDFPTIDISNVKAVDGTSFRFFLSIKNNTNDANPILYTSKKFYDELTDTYLNNNPYYIPAASKPAAIVVVVLNDLKQKVEALHFNELNATADNGVLVLKNLFVNSNFDIDIDPSVKDYKKAVSNPTYNIDDVVRYIDWVVSKPNANYDDRLISGKKLGRWKYNTNAKQTIDSGAPKVDELPNNLNNPTTFPPIGRPGDFQNEVDSDSDGNDWKWDSNTQQWKQLTTQETPPQSTSNIPTTPPVIGSTPIPPISYGGGSSFGGGGPSRYYR